MTFSKILGDIPEKQEDPPSFLRRVPITRRNSLLNKSFENNLDGSFELPAQFNDMMKSMEFGNNTFEHKQSLDMFNFLKSNDYGDFDPPLIDLKRNNSFGGSSLIFPDKKEDSPDKTEKRELRRRESFMLKSNDSFGAKKI